MKSKITLLLLLTFITTLCYGRNSFNEHLFAHPKPNAPGPWLTGPILTPSGHVVPKGHANYEPYLYWTQINGFYDSDWHVHSRPLFTNVLLQGSMQFGIIQDWEFDLAPQLQFNQTHGQRQWRASDLPITLGYQLLEDEVCKVKKWWPSIKLRLSFVVPLGKYDNLSPSHLGTDVGGNGGNGSWYPGIGLVFSKLYEIKGAHYLSQRVSLGYSFGTPVGVEGLNVYGGAPATLTMPATSGTVYPGNIFTFLSGSEFTLTQNWALALDILYQHTDTTRFSGFSPPGTTPGVPSQELFALAPGIEYNWSANVGIIAGPVVTVAGRNAAKFIQYVVALNIYV